MKTWNKYWYVSTPPRIFALISLVLIVVVVVAIGYTQSKFFENELIEHEAVIVGEMVLFLAREELQAEDFENYKDVSSQSRFNGSLSLLKNIPGVIRIKLYNSDGTVIWSDVKEMVGEHKSRTKERIAQMWSGTPSRIFDPYNPPSHLKYPLPHTKMVEFFVPITVKKSNKAGGEVRGLVEVYRSANDLISTLRHGMLLLWLSISIGGVVLFVALFHLFRSVYRRQHEIETQFRKLSTEHERIVQMEKLSAMGRMVSEIAHQINNPLVGVINLSQLAEREIDKPERVLDFLNKIRKAGEHCSNFVQRMLRFSQLARFEPQSTEIAGLVRDTIGFYSQSVTSNIPIELVAPDCDVMLFIDPVLLRHALFNLINNAAQADPRGPIRISVMAEPRESVAGWSITVTDCGAGLSAEVMKHLFTPFYTTRPGGIGLGLSVAQHIVLEHGGRLYGKNNPEGGASFVIWLPTQKAAVIG